MNISERIGVPALLEQTAEECAELAQALLKESRRLRGENPTPKSADDCHKAIEEEMGDVFVCVAELIKSGYGIDVLGARMKQSRWKNRIEKKEREEHACL